jgi:hypothetical protein
MKIAEPEHRRFSPSSLHRVFECPASVKFIESLPSAEYDKGSIFAQRGTCAHAVAEKVLKSKMEDWKSCATPDDYIGSTIEGILVDDDIVKGVNVYINHIVERFEDGDIKYFTVEKQLDLSPLAKSKLLKGINPYDIGGTMDFIAVGAGLYEGTLIVNDYKNGSGVVVEVADNPQLLTYAVCAYLEYRQREDIDTVEVGITQPNAYHEHGAIRYESYSVKELMEWFENTLLVNIRKALEPTPQFNPSEGACHWCNGKHKCKAAYDHVCDSALAEFSDQLTGEGDMVTKVTFPDINTLKPEDIERLLINADLIGEYVKSVKEYAHAKAEAGEPITDQFKLVKKRSLRKYKGNEASLRKMLKRLHIANVDYLTQPAMKSPAQLEKVMKGKKIPLDAIQKFQEVFVEQPDNGNNYVHVSKPGKEVQPSIEADFANLMEDTLEQRPKL